MLSFSPGSILPGIFALLGTVVFTRLLGAAEYGRYMVALATSLTISMASSQWIVQGLNRYLPGEVSRARILWLKYGAIMNAAWTAAAACVLGALALLALAWRQSAWLALLLPVTILILTNMAYAPLTGILQGEEKGARYSAYRSVESALRFGFALVFFAVQPTAAAILWAAPASQFLLLPFLWRDTKLTDVMAVGHQRRPVRVSLRRIATYGIPMSGWFLAAALLDAGDRYVIEWFRGSAEVGLYAANYSIIAGSVAVACMPILMAAHPMLMRAWNAGEKQTAGGIIADLSAGMLMIGGVLMSFVALFSRELSRFLVSSEFASGHQVMPIVVAGFIVWQVGSYAHKPIEFAKHTGLLLGLALAAAFLNILLNIIFVPVYGFIAAAWATLITYALYAVTVFIIGQRTLPWHLPTGKMVYSGATTLVTYIIATAVRSHFRTTGAVVAGNFTTCAILLVGSAFALLPLRTLSFGTPRLRAA